MWKIPKGISPFFDNNTASSGPTPPVPVPIGDLFTDLDGGNYTDSGTASHILTTGNLAISGGNGFFQNIIILNDVVHSLNNFYIESEIIATNTNNNQFGTSIGMISVNSTQNQNIAVGPYYYSPANEGLLYIFGQPLNSGPINPTQPGVTIPAGDRVRVRLDFVESVLTCTITNLDSPDTVSDSYTFSYALLAPQIKFNTGKIFWLAPQSTINVKTIKFGSDYLNRPDRFFQGDSITSGYYQQTQAQRYVDQYATATGRTYAIAAGPGDRSVECSNTTALGIYTRFIPGKVLIFCGTNDIANGASVSSVITNINTIISAWVTSGISISNIYVAEAIPRDGVDVIPLNSSINAISGVSKVQWYSTMEDPGTPGNLNPAYTQEPVGSAIHPDDVGATVMSNFLQSIGF